MKIGDLFLALGVDSVDFKTAITKEAEAAGKAGAASLSKSMATGLKVGSALLGGAFALMTKGALEMEKAQGKFQAATGKSREEAVAFTKDMNGLVGTAATVGMTFEQIADTGIMVEQQFGTSGQATKDLTENILAFSKVTGQDAVQAAADLEDTLSAFGLGADDAAGFMDKLVKSNQEFGTDAGPAALQAMRDMAPALTAVGMTADDGVEALNAFEVAGLDVATAGKAMTKSLAELKPGQTLDDLIAQIGAIEDPLLRAQRAAEVFGTKAGAKLALVIKPGMDSLDEFGVTAEESAGAVDQAADDMLTTTDKIKMFGDKIGGVLRGLGQDFGPLVTGLATVATLAAPFAKSIGSMLLNVAKDAAVAFGGSTVGTAIGVALIEAQALAQQGQAAIGKLVGSVLAAQIPMAGAGTTVGTAIGGAISAGVVIGLAGLGILGGLAVEEIIVAGGTEWLNTGKTAATTFGEGWSQEIKDHYALVVQQAFSDASHHRMPFQQARQAGLDAGAEYLASVGITIADGGPVVGDALAVAMSHIPIANAMSHVSVTMAALGEQGGQVFGDHVVQGVDHSQFEDGLLGQQSAAIAAMMNQAADAKHVGEALADGLEAGIPSVHQAWDDYVTAMKNALDPMKELAWAQARLAGDKLAAGLDSKNPLTRRRAEVMRDNLMAEIAQLQQLMGTEAEQGSDALANNLDGGPVYTRAREIMRKLAAIFNARDFNIGLDIAGGNMGGNANNRAGGGYTPPGWTWTGENGPELQYFDKPSYIVPNNKLGDVMGGSGAPTFNVDVTINGDADPTTVQRAVRDGIADATGFHFGIQHAGSLRYRPTG